ncbi:carbohydrate-binding module family 1 protein [Sphaerobolus stellatus SS14]|nr:carbohydrate-binding module family 1 protein [Sphaerobolus stellatus SS14]
MSPPDITHIDEPALARERKRKLLLAFVGRKFLLDGDEQPPLSGRFLRCGGQGWSGATTCVSGYVCTYSNPYYSQCLPGTATSSSSPPITSNPVTTSKPTTTQQSSGGSTPTTTTSGTATLLPSQLWIRADETPNFHKYLQSQTPGTVGDAVLGPTTSAAQFNVASGQLIQFLTGGSKLYAQVATAQTGTTRLKVFWSTTPATNVTWTFNGDGLNGVVQGATQQNTGAFLACNDVSSAVPNVYLNLGAYDYMTPANCADQTLNYYNGATAVS